MLPLFSWRLFSWRMGGRLLQCYLSQQSYTGEYGRASMMMHTSCSCAGCAHSVVQFVFCCAADEQARLGALRAQLGAMEQERTGELEARVKGMQDLSAALQVGRLLRTLLLFLL